MLRGPRLYHFLVGCLVVVCCSFDCWARIDYGLLINGCFPGRLVDAENLNIRAWSRYQPAGAAAGFSVALVLVVAVRYLTHV